MNLPTKRHYDHATDYPSLEAAIHSALDFCQGVITAAKEWCADRRVT
jgi:hypothetical protein